MDGARLIRQALVPDQTATGGAAALGGGGSGCGAGGEMGDSGQMGGEDWLAAGFRVLLRQGPAAVRPEVLAQDLGANEADFHRHFPDMAVFRAEMLADWAARAYGDVMAGVEAEAGPAAQLWRMGQLLVSHPGAAEDAAMRIWARENAAVAQAVAELDARRLNAVKALCLAAGASDPEVPLLIYALSAGYAAVAPPGRAEAGMQTLLRLAGISPAARRSM